MGNQVATLRRGKRKVNKMVNGKDDSFYRIGLFTFIVFVFAVSSLVAINIYNLLP
ncbi:hypothetical protein [Flavobacterium sp.]|jgi:hypothetical protein|uniref:hypothetical protein n=1 Tax=Flavobacterium sp. TaxID=239 RepID=UPI00260ACCF0|nr:hypothetical protein [Flavobacterium sp.]MDG2433152.1 hypothetical protein [Flavobacterium sp.]